MKKTSFLQTCRKLILSTTVIIAMAGISSTAAEPIKVTLLSPDPPENPFWGMLMKFMHAVAEDLDDVELNVVISNGGSSYALKRDGLKLIENADKPDYVITGYWTGATDKMFEAAKPYGIKYFIINTNISEIERLKADKPRVRYPDWIGHMMPDDFKGGHDQANILIEKARQLPNIKSGALQIAGLGGTEDSSVAADRNAGLKKRVASDANAHLNEIIDTTWYRPTAEKATGEIMERYPATSIIWTAADALALGAIDVLKSRGKTPGKDIVVGGFDWSDDGLEAVKNGDLAVSMGGHFMEAGWALLLIYDYHHGIDFARETGSSMVTPLFPVTHANIDSYIEKLGDKDWSKIDFKKFSKKHNADLKTYSFTLDNLLENIPKDTLHP